MNWATIASLATAGGTLVLAVSTFASVRSANRAARAAERSLQAGLRPLLVPSRLDDGDQKVYFAGGQHVMVPGGQAIVTEQSGAILLTISLRNAGSGLAVMHGWRFYRYDIHGDMRPEPEDFTGQSRDLYVPAGDAGFWQGAFRDPADPGYQAAQQAIKERDVLTIDLLYGDFEGGQRVITRFILRPGRENILISSAIRHWNVDRSDPR
ncbi:MAG TPA: hypothetical protein VMF87_09820 [Streptosporangiaceae bacterium]|nr:hypothetical protein [Streptosporangiaceae bacterium]